MKKLLIVLTLIMILGGCKRNEHAIGKCPKCGYTVKMKLYRDVKGHYRIPRVGCPSDLTILEWSKEVKCR